MTGETREQHEARVKAAEIAHQVFYKNSENVFGMVAGFANGAMRAPAIAAAGGIAAALGFYSANASTLKGSPAALDFTNALTCFFVAVFLCVLAPGIAYFSQSAFVHGLGTQVLVYDHPFSKETAASKRWRRLAVALQMLTILIVLGSIAAVALGACYFMQVANFTAR